MRLDGILFIVALSVFIWVLWLFWMGARTKRKNEEIGFEEKPKRKLKIEPERETFEHTHLSTTLWAGGHSTRWAGLTHSELMELENQEILERAKRLEQEIDDQLRQMKAIADQD